MSVCVLFILANSESIQQYYVLNHFQFKYWDLEVHAMLSNAVNQWAIKRKELHISVSDSINSIFQRKSIFPWNSNDPIVSGKCVCVFVMKKFLCHKYKYGHIKPKWKLRRDGFLCEIQIFFGIFRLFALLIRYSSLRNVFADSKSINDMEYNRIGKLTKGKHNKSGQRGIHVFDPMISAFKLRFNIAYLIYILFYKRGLMAKTAHTCNNTETVRKSVGTLSDCNRLPSIWQREILEQRISFSEKISPWIIYCLNMFNGITKSAVYMCGFGRFAFVLFFFCGFT